MLGKYDKIDYVKYNDGTCAYLITGEGAEINDLEVDIESDCFFNTSFKVIERTTVKIINNIHDIIDFAKGLNIDLYPRYNGTYLLVGGEKDCGIFDNLEYDWIHEHKEEWLGAIEE